MEASLFVVLMLHVYTALADKPIVTYTSPQNRKYNAIILERISLSISYSANPALLAPGSNWTFSSSRGIAMNIPDNSLVGYYTIPSLSFNLTSVSYYGNYSYALTNAVGTTTVTFEVLPPGPPDPPAGFQVLYTTHFSIVLKWSCMWSNFNSHYQYVYTQLKEPGKTVVVDSYNYSVIGTCYNTTYNNIFYLAIQPDTEYEASIWSSNQIGSSSVAKLNVRSQKVWRFVVSSDTIHIKGTTAVINYQLENGNITRLYVSCCYELTGACTGTNVDYPVTNVFSQVSLYIGSLPQGTEYVFEFFLYVGVPTGDSRIAGSVKGVRVSTAVGQIFKPAGNSDSSQAVIALAVVLAVAVFAIAGMLIGFFVWKRRNHFPTSQPQQPNRSGTSRAEAVVEDHYEEMDRQTRDNQIYTNLDHSKRR